MPSIAGASAAALLLLIAALHVYWALGGVWPGRDRDELARMVVGGPEGMAFPSRGATWAVVVVLLVGVGTVLAATGLIGHPFPVRMAKGAALVGAALLLARGLEGFLDVRLRPQTEGSPFARLNVVLYSPLCLVLAGLIALTALG